MPEATNKDRPVESNLQWHTNLVFQSLKKEKNLLSCFKESKLQEYTISHFNILQF